jgi:hypothetical protein
MCLVYTSTLYLAFEVQDRAGGIQGPNQRQGRGHGGRSCPRKLDAKIAEKEAELEELRKTAWEKRNGILKDL